MSKKQTWVEPKVSDLSVKMTENGNWYYCMADWCTRRGGCKPCNPS